MKKNNWQIKKLCEICNTGAGGTPLKSHKDYYISGNIPWLRSGEICRKEITQSELFITKKGLKNSSARLFPKDTVLIAMYGATAGQVGILRFESTTNQAVCGILPSKNTLSEFLYYFFLTEKENLISQATGNAQPNISQIKIKNTRIPFLSIENQHRIVKMLDEVFEKIAKAKENAEKNLQNSKELFASYLQSAFVNTKKGWEEKALKEIGKTQTGSTPKTAVKKYFGDYISFITPADVDILGNGSVRYGSKGLSREGLSVARKIEKNSVVMVCIGATIGKVGFAEQEISCNQQINTLTPKSSYDAKFFYYALSTKSFFEQVINGSSQATLPIINKGKWENLSISFPKSLTEQKSIVAKLDALSAETKKLEVIYKQKIADLEELKKSVLKKAFSGEL